jgi:hypothetical protein
MAPPKWEASNIFKPIDMSRICSFPHNMPGAVHSWLLKFSGNDHTIADDHLKKFYDDLGLHVHKPPTPRCSHETLICLIGKGC